MAVKKKRRTEILDAEPESTPPTQKIPVLRGTTRHDYNSNVDSRDVISITTESLVRTLTEILPQTNNGDGNLIALNMDDLARQIRRDIGDVRVAEHEYSPRYCREHRD